MQRVDVSPRSASAASSARPVNPVAAGDEDLHATPATGRVARGLPRCQSSTKCFCHHSRQSSDQIRSRWSASPRACSVDHALHEVRPEQVRATKRWSRAAPRARSSGSALVPGAVGRAEALLALVHQRIRKQPARRLPQQLLALARAVPDRGRGCAARSPPARCRGTAPAPRGRGPSRACPRPPAGRGGRCAARSRAPRSIGSRSGGGSMTSLEALARGRRAVQLARTRRR